MQYLYFPLAGAKIVELKGDEYRYLAKVRRVRQNERVHLRNLEDETLYSYEVIKIDRRVIQLSLSDSQTLKIAPKRWFHLGWAMIEPKNIQKTLPALNEIGVSKITFFYGERSQKSYKLDLEKLKKIVINSSQQSGRSEMMELDFCDNLPSFLEKNPDSFMLNFSENLIKKSSNIDTIVVGSEGGFTQSERELFGQRVVGLDSNIILQSHTATVAVSSITLL